MRSAVILGLLVVLGIAGVGLAMVFLSPSEPVPDTPSMGGLSQGESTTAVSDDAFGGLGSNVGENGLAVTTTAELARVDRDTYDLGCSDRVLGMQATDRIFHDDGEPTGDELAKLEKCLVGGSSSTLTESSTSALTEKQTTTQPGTTSKKETGKQEMVLGDSTLEDEDQSTRNESVTERPEYQRKCLRNEEAYAIGPDCNVSQKPLPPGVISADLVDILLPESAHKLPASVDCEIFEGDQCAELRWEPVSELLAGEFTAIAISPTDPDILFAGTDSNDMSLYKSTDAGATWQLFDVQGHVSGVAISPANPDIVLYTNLEAPVRQTVDGGWKWQSAFTIVTEDGMTPFTTIAFSPDNPNVVYTANVPGPSRGGFYPPKPAGIFVSKNAGLDWEQTGVCECGSIRRLVVQPGNPDVVWSAGDGGVRVSRDGGGSWSEDMIRVVLTDTVGPARDYEPEAQAIGLALRPGDSQTILAASAEAGMYRSADGGKSWSAVNTGLETFMLHDVVFAPSDPDVAYVATHDGVYRSEDAGQSWKSRSNGLKHTFLAPIAVDPRDADVVYVGTNSEIYTTHPKHFAPGMQDGAGLYKTTDGGQNWYRQDKGIYEAKLAQMSAHPMIPLNFWAGGESGRGAFFSPDAGDTWLFSPFMGAHYPMVFEFSRSFPIVQYLTAWTQGGELSKSTDAGASWFLLTAKIQAGISELTRSLGLVLDEPPKYHLHGLAVAPSNPNIVYVGSVHDSVYADVGFNLYGAHIFKSTDGGVSFTEMSDGFPIKTPTAINAIVVHPENPDVAYIMTSLHESTTSIGIYKTTDGAQSWAAVSNGLDPETNDLQMDRLAPDTLYAATESGVYKTADGAKTWQLASDGLPLQFRSPQYGPVIDLAMDPVNPLVLYAITPEHVYRTKNGADNWYQVDLGLPLDGSSDPVAAGKAPMAKIGESMGHQAYGGYFAQDRTLEIDATGRVVYVAVKLGVEEGSIRHLYRAVIEPLLSATYQFELQGESMPVESTSHVYDMVYDQNSQELRFIAAGPVGTTGVTTVTVPDQFLSAPFSVLVDGVEVSSDNAAGSVSFEYAHSGRSNVIISMKSS